MFNQGMWQVGDGCYNPYPLDYSKTYGGIWGFEAWMKITTGPNRPDLFNETKLAEMENEYNSTIFTIYSEYWTAAIAGNVDIDATWDKYLSDLDKAGYQNILEELNKASLYEEIFPGKTGLK